MGTGVTPSLGSPKVVMNSGIWMGFTHGRGLSPRRAFACMRNEFYGQAERAISTGQLLVLLRFHIQPINVVVFHGPS